MPFNTAVLYDLENLLGGYSFNARLVADLSLKEIRRYLGKIDDKVLASLLGEETEAPAARQA